MPYPTQAPNRSQVDIGDFALSAVCPGVTPLIALLGTILDAELGAMKVDLVSA